jgi:hypothetical protein
MRRLSRSSESATAFHEAGHAVVGFHEGIRLRSASIIPDADRDGVVRWHSPFRAPGLVALETGVSYQARRRIEKYARAVLAGNLAQRKFRARSIRSWHPYSDFVVAENFVSRACRSREECVAYLELLSVQANDTLKFRWDQVETVAAALIDRKQLSGSELLALLTPNFTS